MNFPTPDWDKAMSGLARAVQKMGYLALETADKLAIFKHELDRPVFDIEVERERMATLRADINALKKEAGLWATEKCLGTLKKATECESRSRQS